MNSEQLCTLFYKYECTCPYHAVNHDTGLWDQSHVSEYIDEHVYVLCANGRVIHSSKVVNYIIFLHFTLLFYDKAKHY